MSPLEELERRAERDGRGTISRTEFEEWKRQVTMALLVGVAIIALSFAGEIWVRTEARHDTNVVRTADFAAIRASECRSNTNLLAQYEFFKELAVANSSHLPRSAIHQRLAFYNLTEGLIPTDPCPGGLRQMRRDAQRILARVDLPKGGSP